MPNHRADNLQFLLHCGLIPVIRAASREEAVELAEALVAAGVPVIELTFTVPGALDAIEAIAARCAGRVLLGAGTVLDRETARLAILAGARFIVSPHLDAEIIAAAHRYDCLAIPGALTPTEVVRALECGADLIKIFPADALGGPKYLAALKAPLPQARLVPTGGVSLENAAAWLRSGAAALGIGSGLITESQRQSRDWAALRHNAQQLLTIIRAQRESGHE